MYNSFCQLLLTFGPKNQLSPATFYMPVQSQNNKRGVSCLSALTAFDWIFELFRQFVIFLFFSLLCYTRIIFTNCFIMLDICVFFINSNILYLHKTVIVYPTLFLYDIVRDRQL
jgi:hypothetical protein